jgi:cell division protein FtsZ
MITDPVTITLDGEKNIDDVLNQEEQEEVIMPKKEEEVQHTIFDNSEEIKVEENLEEEIEQEEEMKINNEIELDLGPQKVVVSLDEEVALPEELIPTLKQEEEVLEEEEIQETAINESEDLPLTQDVLTNKSRERDDRLKNISMKLRTPSGLTSLEDEPAYKRDNVELEETPHSSESEVSKYTLSEGEDNKTEIKPNNSFLHDNVD